MSVITPGDATPKVNIKVNFAAGLSGPGTSDAPVMILANYLSSGSASANTIYGPNELTSEQDAISLFGAGSEAHRMVRKFLSKNQVSSLYLCTIAENNSATASSGTIVVTGTATANATLTIFVGDDFVSCSIVAGDTITAIGDAIEDAINAKVSLPVTASNTGGTVTLISKQKSTRANLIKVMVRLSNACGSTFTKTSDTALTGGTVVDDVSDALDLITEQGSYHIVAPHVDSTNLGLVKAHLETQNAANVGDFKVCHFGHADTVGNSTTIFTTLNSEFMQGTYQLGSSMIPGELAALSAACVARDTLGDRPKLNFNGADFGFVVPRSKEKLTKIQVESCLRNGMSVVDFVPAKETATLVRLVSTRSLTSGQPETRIRDFGKVIVMHKLAKDVRATYVRQFSGLNIGNDATATVEQQVGTVSPRNVKSMLVTIVSRYFENGLIENLDQTKSSIKVSRPLNQDFLEAEMDVDVIDIANSFGATVSQIG